MHFVSLQIFVTIRVNENFFVQMTSCTVCYDVFYLLFPINSQYQKTWVANSPDYRTGLRDNNHGLRKNLSSPEKSETYDVLVTSPDALPLTYRILEGFKAIRLQ